MSGDMRGLQAGELEIGASIAESGRARQGASSLGQSPGRGRPAVVGAVHRGAVGVASGGPACCGRAGVTSVRWRPSRDDGCAGSWQLSVVIVSGDRIEAVGELDRLPALDGSEVIDLRARSRCGLTSPASQTPMTRRGCWSTPWRGRLVRHGSAAVTGAGTSFPSRTVTSDAMGFDRSVILACTSLHRGVVSSHGLEVLHVDANTPDPPGGGSIALSCQPTRLLVETAWSQAHSASLTGIEHDRYADLIQDRLTVAV